MILHRFEVPGLAQYGYLVGSEGRAAVIDPMRDIEPVLSFAREHLLTITHVLETHIHADFASGATALAAATGAELALSAYDEDEMYQYTMPHLALRSGDGVRVGQVRLETLHTPGHTPEHLSFVLFEGDAIEPSALFSGDFLFVGSLGRPDLLGEEAKRALARELYRSVHERIADLPGTVRVYPGHGAGSFCGAGMSDAAESTLADERRSNRLFQLQEAAFLRQILGSVPPMPAYYPRMKRLNAAGAPVLSEIPGGRGLTVAEVSEFAARSAATLLDVREARAYAAGHVPGSIHIGDGPSLSLWAGWLLDASKEIVLIGGADEPAAEAARLALLRVGLDRLVGYLEGGMAAWQAAGLPLALTARVAPERLDGDTVVLDVRNPSEWMAGHIAGAQHIPLGELRERITELPEGRAITVVCEAGYRASIAASLLAANGYGDVSVLAGGMEAWERVSR